MKLQERIRRRLRQLARITPSSFSRVSWAQEGEDIALVAIFNRLGVKINRGGFYVDVGAHHPKRYSNTHYFYLWGWSGINIDATPGSMKPFRKIRTRDINLEIGVSRHRGSLPYHLFNEPALNTFSPQVTSDRTQFTNYQLLATVDVPTLPLADILTEHLPAGRSISFLSIDVEGLDVDVVESNDWTRFRPRVVLSECLTGDVRTLADEPIVHTLATKGYVPIAMTGRSIFFLQELDAQALAGGLATEPGSCHPRSST